MKLPVLSDSSTAAAWYAQGLQFTCTQCGNCCTGGPGYVWITNDEIIKLAEYLKLSPEETVERYCRKIGGRFSLKEQRSSTGEHDCIFLVYEEAKDADRSDEDEKVHHAKRACSVYPARPLQCRTWPFWSENLSSESVWNRSSKKCHGINRGRSFSLKQIHAIKDAADWPKNPPTSSASKSG